MSSVRKSKNAVDLTQKTFFVMTGASRGIGRTMAIECAAKMATGSVIVLIARTAAGLEETKAQILAKNPSNVTVFLITLDLTRPSAEQISSQIFDATLNERNLDEFKLAMIVHNVGSIGDVKRYAKDFCDMDEWHDYYAINVFSVIAMNTEFLKRFNTQTRRLVVNISSKLALQPCKSLTMYCSGKAAREMYFRTLALEECERDSALSILNYAPGPVQTEMTEEIETSAVEFGVREVFKGLRETKTMLQPIETTIKFLRVIESGDYESGAHIDYYDN
ncbi:sepiapterin reductase-like [Contarinia nasturtii]|uniref:sepiapterin reductase-like n=1 Tax=Contarinia nasturtii TaxID=265458 RepID=UPI0012D372B0|nr:sepiapterin reductase-like [Contarinia nasturtii]